MAARRSGWRRARRRSSAAGRSWRMASAGMAPVLLRPPRHAFVADAILKSTLMAVVGMLKNPAYAGTFVYGRTRSGPPATPGGRPVQLPRPSEGCRFVVRDKYPAYIDAKTFEKVQAMLEGNRADY